VNEYQQAGTYSLPISVDQLSLSNGVYFYKLSTNNSSEINSMVFIK
jgi:hypothetical protein